MCIFRPNIIANPSLHSEAKHQLAQQIQKYRVNGGGMAKSESTRYSQRRIFELDLNDMPAVIDEVESRSFHRRGLLVELDMRTLADYLVRFWVIGLSAAKLDSKRLKPHNGLRQPASDSP